MRGIYRFSMFGLFFLAGMFMLTACGGGGEAGLGTTLVSIEVTPTNPSIAKGTTVQFAATGIYSDKTTKDLTSSVTWASSDTSKAAISNAAGSNGLATSYQAGSTTITVTSVSVSGTTTLTVTDASLVSISVTPTDLSIAKGLTEQYTATGTFSDGTTQDITGIVTWNSSNETVAAISNAAGSNGLATSYQAGSTTITATSVSVSGTTTLTVTDASLVSISVTPIDSRIAEGLTEQFTATGTYTDSTTQDITGSVTWSSSNDIIASVSNAAGSKGLATSIAAGGPITITATDPATNITASTTLTIVQSGETIWEQTSSFSSDSEAYAVAVDTNYVYLAGYNETNETCDGEPCSQWRIEKRSLGDGSLTNSISIPATSYWDSINAMTIDDASLYVVGIDAENGWKVEKRNLSDLQVDSSWGTVHSTPTFSYDTAMAVSKDATHLYIAGYSEDGSHSNKIWRIEKRRIGTGALETGFDYDGILTSTTGIGGNEAMAIALDPTNNALFVAGYDSNGWRIEKRSSETGELITGFDIDGIVNSVSGSANAITFDADYLYIAGHREIDAFNTSLWIEKRRLSDGFLEASADGPTSGNNSLNGIVLDASCMYVAGYSKGSLGDGDYEWHIEKRTLDLTSDSSFGINGVLAINHSTGDDTAWSIAADSNYIYAVGFDSQPGHFQWRVEKIVK